jgi:hypothetical protein
VRLADQADGARLRSFDALFLDEADLSADGQAVESAAENRVAVKIDFAAVGRFNEAAIFPSEEFRHPAMILTQAALDLVVLDLAAHVARDVLDLPHRGVERFPNRDQRVLALGRVAASPRDHDVVTFGHRDSDVDFEEFALPVSRFWPGDRHMTARDPIAELFQASGLFSDFRSDFLGGFKVLKGDLDWRLHDAAPFFRRGVEATPLGAAYRTQFYM